MCMSYAFLSHFLEALVVPIVSRGSVADLLSTPPCPGYGGYSRAQTAYFFPTSSFLRFLRATSYALLFLGRFANVQPFFRLEEERRLCNGSPLRLFPRPSRGLLSDPRVWKELFPQGPPLTFTKGYLTWCDWPESVFSSMSFFPILDFDGRKEVGGFLISVPGRIALAISSLF